MKRREYRLRRQKLLIAIQAAFRDVALEDGITLRQAAALDGYGDEAAQAEARKQDEGIHWSRISPKTLQELDCPLSFLDPKGFRFYLPAYMIAALKENPCDFYVHFHLMQESGVSQRKTQPANIAAKYGFSPSQIRVIADFLELIHPEVGIQEADRIVISRWRELADAQPPE
jgi:hypothetical protein